MSTAAVSCDDASMQHIAGGRRAATSSHAGPLGRAVVFVTLLAIVGGLGAGLDAVTAAAAGAKASDAAIARQGLLRLSDFPAGWTQHKHKESKPSGIPACKPTEQVVAKSKKYRSSSPDFAQGELTLAQNTVLVFPKPAQATAYLAPYQLDSAGKCLQQGTEKAFRKVKGTTVDVQQLDLSSAIQAGGGTIDDAVGYELRVTAPQPSGNIELFLVAVAIRTGRAVAGYTTENQNQPLADTDSLINASLTRLVKALG
jgi:hypothetical protein